MRTYVILDMRRVQSVDVTAAHMLKQIKDMLTERDGFLIFQPVAPEPAQRPRLAAVLRPGRSDPRR
ncbi:STAS domain-containing protein [Undibacterium arcticum]